jgi:hypothetical protein
VLRLRPRCGSSSPPRCSLSTTWPPVSPLNCWTAHRTRTAPLGSRVPRSPPRYAAPAAATLTPRPARSSRDD